MSGTRYVVSLLLLHVACNWTATAVGVGYGYFALLPHLQAGVAARAGMWIIGSILVGTVVLGPWLLAQLIRSAGVIDRLRAGEDVTVAERRAACRPALNAPMRHALSALAIWLSALAAIPLLFDESDVRAPGVLLHGMGTTLLVGFVAFTCTLYFCERFMAARVLPALLGPLSATEIPGVVSLSIRVRIALLLGTTCATPVAVLTIAALGDKVSPAATLYLCVCFMLLGILQGRFIVRAIGGPVAQVASAMAQVRRDELELRVPVVSNDALGALGAGFNQMVDGLRRGRDVKQTFGRYLAPHVVDEILEGRVALGGEERFVTVLFTDLRGFTAASEDLSPTDVVRFLNQFLDRMVDVLVRHGGTIDKFIGDSVMATFGVPVSRSREEDALAAVRAAVEMVRVLEAWNVERAQEGHAQLRIGIGIHSGVVVAGNIGSSRKLEYTVIGDTVNTASRIEALTKVVDAPVLISAQTHALVAAHITAEEQPPVEVRGKKVPLVVHAVRSARASSGGEAEAA